MNDIESGGVDAQIAMDILNETTRRVMDKGWHWNRELHTLSPDSNGFINLPANTSRVDTTGYDKNVDVVQRGLRLFDRTNNTYVFNNPIQIEIYVLLEWDELPNTARLFIAYSSAATFQKRMLSSDTLDKMLEKNMTDAWIELVRAEMEVADYNMVRDNWSVLGAMQRAGFNRGNYL
ncbi:hypothetical protein M2320_004446 [Rhodoblastus acidophilus]|nr:hypothetical protein [Rhodoblastus acidophilus]